MYTEQRKAIASKFFDDSHELMSILYSRWQDEKEYEDIADYGKVISEKVDAIGGSICQNVNYDLLALLRHCLPMPNTSYS
jgi:hypothetical protein